MPVGRRFFPGGPLIILVGIVPFLIYHVLVGAASPLLIGAVVVVQVVAIVWLAASRLAVRYRAAAALGALGVVVAALLCPGVPARSVGLAVGGLCHAAAYTSLLVWFAASLRAGQEPVV